MASGKKKTGGARKSADAEPKESLRAELEASILETLLVYQESGDHEKMRRIPKPVRDFVALELGLLCSAIGAR